jgi:Uri superfamily endonuclease
MLIKEFITQEDMNELEEKATRALCTSTKSNKELGASNLSSCKSQGFRAREGKKSHKLGKSSKSRVVVGGHKIKGSKYGGPLPDWS